jgi:hypothetical protein
MTQGSDQTPKDTDPNSSHALGNATQRILIVCLLAAIILLIVFAAISFR